MKRIITYFWIALIMLCAFIGFSNNKITVNAATGDAYLIMANPAEDSNTGVRITWHSKVSGTFVEYTLKTDTNFRNSTKAMGIANSCTIYNGTTESNVTDYKCYVELTNLKSGTEYIYRVGKTTMSKVYSFKTGGTGDFSFGVIGDIHTYASLTSRIGRADDSIGVLEKHSDLSMLLCTGDQVAYGSHRDEWESLCAADFIQNYMFASTPGNHDMDTYVKSTSTKTREDTAKYFNAYTSNPTNGPDCMKNSSYYFYYNDILFVCWDYETMFNSCGAVGSADYVEREAAKAWLEDVLSKNTASYIIVMQHKTYSPGSGSNGSHARVLSTHFGPIMDKYGVDVVFGADDHVYVRTENTYNKTAAKDSLFGTTYFTNFQNGDRGRAADTSVTSTYNIVKMEGGTSLSGAILVDVTKDALTISAYTHTGTLVDNCVIPSKMSTLNMSQMESKTNITCSSNLSNMTLKYDSNIFQRATNIKVYDNNKVVVDFRPQYNQSSVAIPGAKATDKAKKYKLEISFRDGTTYTKDYLIVNSTVTPTFNAEPVNATIDNEIPINITNNLGIDLDYKYIYDSNYIELKDGKLYAKQIGSTIIKASYDGLLTNLNIPVTISAYPGYVTPTATPIEIDVNSEIIPSITNDKGLDITYDYQYDSNYITKINGSLYAKKPGTTTIKAINTEYFIEIDIPVTINITAGYVNVSSSPITVLIGNEINPVITNDLNLDLEYEYIYDTTYIELINNKLYAKQIGTTSIIAKNDDYLVSCEIPVTINAYPGYLTLSSQNIECRVNGSFIPVVTNSKNLNIIITYEFDSEFLTYANGIFTANKLGNTTITAKNADFSASCEIPVTINAYEGYIQYNANPISCIIDDAINPQITNSLNLNIEYQYTYDPTFFKLENGTLYATKAGNTVIIATNQEYFANVIINVTISEIPTCNVFLDSNGGELGTIMYSATIGEIILPYTPTKEGYKFVGWYKDQALTQAYNNEPIENDTILYAKWEKAKGCNNASFILMSNITLLGIGIAFLRKRRSL